MKITLPRSRFHLNSSSQSCSITKLPVLVGKLEGGAQSPIKAKPNKNVYVVIGSDGFPVKEHREYRKYEAQKPYQAAIKAYYGLLRSKKPINSTVPPSSDVQRIIENVSKTHTKEEMVFFSEKLQQARLEMPALINLRRIDDSKIKSYVCYYELIENPNRHEISKGIVKVAKTEELTKYKQKRNLTEKDSVSLLSY